jgi:hypothetical protein
MNKRKYIQLTGLILAAILLFSACRKRDDVLMPDNLVTFESTALGLATTENSITVKIKLSRNTDRDIPVSINLTSAHLVYGTHYTTTPASVGGVLNLTIPSGNNETTFTVSKVAGAAFAGDETVLFYINSSAAPVLIGNQKQFTLSFGELIATASAYSVNGGGATFPNTVFIDLSSNRQTGINRTTWDLGFYTDPSDFRVILNSSVAMMVKQVAKNDLASVVPADTLGFSADVAYSQTAPAVSQMAYIDYPNGDITKTAIAPISATATDNKVYIVNRGNGVGNPAPVRGWKKIRIIRNTSGGYTLQYADIAATTFTSVDIPKDATHFFKYVSLDNGAIVSVAPEKKKWDLAWSYFGNVTNFGGGEVPYMFQDIIIQNRNVEVVKVMTATIAYAAFTESNLSSLTFSTSQTTIGADWRSGGGPGTPPAVRTDRFYIIKDGDNNYYKLRFTALTNGGGERGYPAVEYALIKKG